MSRIQKTRLCLFLLAITAAVCIFIFWREYLTFSFWKENLGAMHVFVSRDPVAWRATYFATYVLITALSIPGAVVLSLASGALFGFGWGLLIASFASSMGADFACALTRWLFTDVIRYRYGKTFMKIDSALQVEGPFYLFAIRLNPAFPYFVTNWLIGLTSMPLWQFHLITQLGMLPATAAYVNAGVQLGSIDSFEGILSLQMIVSLAVLGVLPLLLRRVLAKKRL